MDGELLVKQKPECLDRRMPIVTQYHVQSQHSIVMGVGIQYVMWITVLSAWLEQVIWPYLGQHQDTSHQHHLPSLAT